MVNTNTAAFRHWFKNSVVVNPDGSPKIVYHGTMAPVNFNIFKPREGYLGIHFGTVDQADWFVADYLPEEGQDILSRIYPVYLSIQNPYPMDDIGGWDVQDFFVTDHIQYFIDSGMMDEELAEKIKKAPDDKAIRLIRKVFNDNGYDGVIYRNETEGSAKTWSEREMSYIVWNPTQIKSASGNRGTFDPTDPSIVHGLPGYHGLW